MKSRFLHPGVVFLLSLMTVIIAVLRFLMPTQGHSWTSVYQAAAHGLIFFCLGGWVFSPHKTFRWLFCILAAVEIYCSLHSILKL